jgi:hypothetical protein
MSIQGAPEDLEQVVGIAAKAKLLKLETEAGSVALSSVSSIDLYAPGPLGLRLAEKQGEIVPSLLVDTKRLRESEQFEGAGQAVNAALEAFEDNETAS